jgi:hypothetical protein
MKSTASAAAASVSASALSTLSSKDFPDRIFAKYLTEDAFAVTDYIPVPINPGPSPSAQTFRHTFVPPENTAGCVEIYAVAGVNVSSSIAKPFLIAQFPIPSGIVLPMTVPLSDPSFTKFWTKPPVLSLTSPPLPPLSNLLTTCDPEDPNTLRSVMTCPAVEGAAEPTFLYSSTSEIPLVLPLTASYLSLVSQHASISSSHVACKSTEAIKHTMWFDDDVDALSNGHAIVEFKCKYFTPPPPMPNKKPVESTHCVIEYLPNVSVFAKNVFSSPVPSTDPSLTCPPCEPVKIHPMIISPTHDTVSVGSLRVTTPNNLETFLIPLGKYNAKGLQNLEIKLGFGTLFLDLTVKCGDSNHTVAEDVVFNSSDGLYSLLSLSDPLLSKHDNDVIGGLYDPALLDALMSQRAQFANLCAQDAHRIGSAAPADPSIPPHLLRQPCNFKPSSAKTEPCLRFIPINAHIQSTTVNGRTLNYVTCGAPADHVGGFSRLGGTRRLINKEKDSLAALETKRLELLRSIAAAQSNGNTHIPVSDIPANKLRDSLASLHLQVLDVSWLIAMRTATCLSHALSIVTTAYLNAVTDSLKNDNAETWTKCGFLITVEGFLSAAGKEASMIEDASAAFNKCKDVSIMIVRGGELPECEDVTEVQERFRTVGGGKVEGVSVGRLNKETGENGLVVYVFLHAECYDAAVPESLKNGVVVRMYPVLFQMGVDIKQWSSNFVSSTTKRGGGTGAMSVGTGDDVDDNEGVAADLLVALNLEAFQKLNKYAHNFDSFGYDDSTDKEIPIHPLLGNLWENVASSKNKIEHGILDAAAQVTATLGGGGVIFCKSGKDRTGMGATLREAQFLGRYARPNAKLEDDLYVLRRFGTRLAVCEKNVGRPKFAFNALQAKFMPDLLKPPMEVCVALWEKEKVAT